MVERGRIDWRLLAVVYGVVAAAFLARTIYNADTIPLIADTDDAMRLVVVRDFLAGQGWYDHVQYRLNPPFGAEIHWSRLADLPLAGLVVILRSFLGPLAETAAAYVLPLLWLFALLVVSARATILLVGREGLLPALVLPAVSLSIMAEFAPGRIDHHSLQVILALAMLWCTLESLSRPRYALWAGLAAATALAIGIEALPMVAAAIAAFGLLWIFAPAAAGAVRLFGVTIAAASFVHLMIALPPDRWLVPACDVLSMPYAAAMAGAGLAFAALSFVRTTGRSLRLALCAAAGLAVAGLVAIVYPDCLKGPYAALDPWLIDNWIGRIREALPLWQAISDDPVYPLAVSVPPAVALIVVVRQALRGPAADRGRWLLYGVFLVLAIAAMLLQVRASRVATSIAVPAGAWLIVAARHHYLATRSLPRIGLLLSSWIVSAGVAVGLIASFAVSAIPGPAAGVAGTGPESRLGCLMPVAFADLAALPPERIMAPVDLGSHLLAMTPHQVVAAPYHRNQQGVRDALDFFNGPIDAARDILDRRGVTLVVVCPSMPETAGRADAAPDSFVRLRAGGNLPGWLVDKSLPQGPLEVYAVLPR